MSDLSDLCDELGHLLAQAEAILGIRDVKPTTRAAGKPGSKPPWNPEVAGALFNAHAGARQLEADLRIAITGRDYRRSPRSGNTGDVLAAIKAMETAMDHPQAEAAHRKLTRWVTAIRQLPGLDLSPKWERIRPGPDGLPPKCPHCGTFSLRVALSSGVVQCWYPGCTDSDGRRPQARLDLSRINGNPVLVWSDGTVQ